MVMTMAKILKPFVTGFIPEPYCESGLPKLTKEKRYLMMVMITLARAQPEGFIQYQPGSGRVLKKVGQRAGFGQVVLKSLIGYF